MPDRITIGGRDTFWAEAHHSAKTGAYLCYVDTGEAVFVSVVDGLVMIWREDE